MLALVAVLTFVGSCAATHERNSTGSTISPRAYTFGEQYELVDSVVLQQSDSNPIAALTTLAVRSDRSFVVGDKSEGNVKIYGADGRLIKVIPLPNTYSIRFGPSGDIYVGEPTPPNITRYSASGDYKSSINVPDSYLLNDFLIAADGKAIVSVLGREHNEVIAILDPRGTPERRFLDGGRLHPSDHPAASEWEVTRRYTLGVLDGKVVIAGAVTDSLWEFDDDSSTIVARAIDLPGRQAPKAPSRPLRGGEEVLEWLHQFHVVPAVFSSRYLLAIPFVKGSLVRGDPTILLIHRNADWEALRDSPAVLAVHDSMLVARLRSSDTSYHLGFYQHKP